MTYLWLWVARYRYITLPEQYVHGLLFIWEFINGHRNGCLWYKKNWNEMVSEWLIWIDTRYQPVRKEVGIVDEWIIGYHASTVKTPTRGAYAIWCLRCSRWIGVTHTLPMAVFLAAQASPTRLVPRSICFTSHLYTKRVVDVPSSRVLMATYEDTTKYQVSQVIHPAPVTLTLFVKPLINHHVSWVIAGFYLPEN